MKTSPHKIEDQQIKQSKETIFYLLSFILFDIIPNFNRIPHAIKFKMSELTLKVIPNRRK